MWSLALHGGAGRIEEPVEGWREGLRGALDAGSAVLGAGGSALDAVCATVVALEEDPLFNAGRGSVLTRAGAVEMDASVMNHQQDGGAVTLVRTTRSPVLYARAVLERTPHALFVGDELARELGLEQVANEHFVTERRRREQAEGALRLDHGTVGAVAVDRQGRCAAATSTGGMTNKWPGRVGDSPILGAGTWADGTCAVSCTGHGELILRATLARSVARWRRDQVLVEAAERALAELDALGGRAGLIAVDVRGHLALPYTTRGMYRAWRRDDGDEGFGS